MSIRRLARRHKVSKSKLGALMKKQCPPYLQEQYRQKAKRQMTMYHEKHGAVINYTVDELLGY